MPPRCPNCARHPARCIECEDRGWNSALDKIDEVCQTTVAMGNDLFLDGYQAALRRIHETTVALKRPEAV
jgi:hypothetical protein